MNSWLYLFIIFLSVSFAFYGNYFLQKKLFLIKNKEKGIDILIEIIRQLECLYIEYWNAQKHCQQTSIKIKITQTQSLSFCDFLHKKYKLNNNELIKLLLRLLITKSTDEDFDSLTRATANTDKSIEIAKNTNKVIIELLKDKI